MSDPAFSLAKLPPSAINIEDVPLNDSAVYVFDFDGVIASGLEDAVYKLPETAYERDKLSVIADRLGIKSSGMELRYQRHLLFQEAASQCNLGLEPGPGFELAKWAMKNARTFVITARSGWGATKRVREFIEENLMPPIEIYQVGRTSKALQIELVCNEFPDRTVFYIEDSIPHLAAAADLKVENLQTVHCPGDIFVELAQKLYNEILEGGDQNERHADSGSGEDRSERSGK